MVNYRINSHCEAISIEAKTSTTAGEDCILASLECLSNYKIYHSWKSGFIVKSENMFTVRQGTSTPPPLARIVSSLLCLCVGNYGFYYNGEL